ncbi:MAG: ABC transporter permease, partial [Chloroflexi bacterium]|nr:ABC transporter permease [Chloroflexota bacterium]
VLLLLGKNPIAAYSTIIVGAIGDSYGWGEIAVKVCPLMLCALAAAVPARIGLVNVGAEGQLYMGAWCASWVALTLGGLPAVALLPLMVIAGAVGGAVWGGIAGALRSYAGLNETIATLMFNYIAVLFVNIFVFGSWKDPANPSWPSTAAFSAAARLPAFGDSRAHLGLLFAVVAVVGLAWVLTRTRWGFEMRAIGGNAEAARWSGIPINRYIIAAMCIGGAMAGLAGMVEVSAIQGRLQPGISNGYGYLGFLASWLGMHHPLGLALAAGVLAAISVGGDTLQLGVNLPAATVNILMGLILFSVLGARRSAKETGL